MKDIITVCGVVLIAIISVIIQPDGNYRTVLSILCAVTVLMFSLDKAIPLIDGIVQRTTVEKNILSIILKSLAIGYITEFGISICKEAGQNTLALASSVFGKICIVTLMFPLIENLLDLCEGMIV